jgi:predicted Zn-dependent peptidase
MSLNRATAPAYHPIKEASLIHASKTLLANNIPLYTLNAGSQELVKIEVVFNAGTCAQNKTLVASATNALMREGTEKYTSNELSETLDFFGAYLETNVEKFSAGFSLYTLNKHLNSVLPILKSVIEEPNFPEKEFDLYIKNNLQRFKISQQKVDVIARNQFPSLIYGENHPYGRYTKESDYNKITNQDLIEFYNHFYKSKIAYILISGFVTDEIIKTVSAVFEKNKNQSTTINSDFFVASPSSSKRILIEKKEAIQSAIRIGRPLFSKSHTDYFGFQVLNTVLGGYFGSRLMSNIREDKGYTYGIGSGLAPFKNGGMFFISTEVGVDVTQNALKEIYHEIKRLREETIPQEELDTVKNYILGIFLKSAEGPFALADKFKGVYDYNLNYDYYNRYFKAVQNITSEELKRLANQYLQEADLFELVVGKRV